MAERESPKNINIKQFEAVKSEKKKKKEMYPSQELDNRWQFQSSCMCIQQNLSPWMKASATSQQKKGQRKSIGVRKQQKLTNSRFEDREYNAARENIKQLW